MGIAALNLGSLTHPRVGLVFLGYGLLPISRNITSVSGI